MCTLTPRRKIHHRHDNFMFESMFLDAASTIDKVVYIIESIKVSYGCCPMFFEHFGEKINRFTTTRIKHYRIDSPGENL